MTDATAKSKPKPKKGEIFRQSRLWHGYLSAFAFLALMFFSATGLLLDHPNWFKPNPKTIPTKTVTLGPADLAAAKSAKEPGRIIAAAVGRQTHLVGAYSSGEVADGQALIRLESAKGSSNLTADLATGKVEVDVERKDLVTVVDELHRGKNATGAWKWVIDITAVVVMVLSLIGYLLFFSLRFRLRTSLILTGVSLAALIAAFVFLIP